MGDSGGTVGSPRDDGIIQLQRLRPPKEEALDHKEDVIPKVEAKVPILEGSVSPENKGRFLERAWLPRLRWRPHLLA